MVYGNDVADGEPTPLVTIPIPLADQAGERNVQGKVELDMSQFKLDDGMELSYQVRVREDRGPNQLAAGLAPQSPSANQKPDADKATAPTNKQIAQNSGAANQPPAPTAGSAGPKQPESVKPAPPGAPPAEAMASSKEPNGAAPPAQPTASSSPGRMAESDRRELSSNTAAKEPAASQPNATASATSPQTAGGAKPQPGDNQTAGAGGANQSSPKSDSPNSGSPSTPSPGDSMTRRSLDVAQSSSSQRMRLKVDQWAGSFSGQQRAKLELAIAPRLAALDEALAKAERTAQGVLDAVNAAGKWSPVHDRDVSSAEQATEHGQELIAELEKVTKETPYAFIGLQVADIGLAHVEPARSGFWTALKSDGDTRVANVRDAQQHLVRRGNCSRNCADSLSGRGGSFNWPSRSSGSRRCTTCTSRTRWRCCPPARTIRSATSGRWPSSS